MDRIPRPLSIKELRHQFVDIDFPEYQREPDIWSREQKQRLIDSILRGFDIASIYFYQREEGQLECIDGRQRINAIMSFLGENEADARDNGFPLKIHNEISSGLVDKFGDLDGKTIDELKSSDAELAVRAVQAVLDYRLTAVYLSGAAEPDEFNLQFLRLNLGTLINAGEKLHAMVGGMRNLIFEDEGLGHHPFFEQIRIPTRRYAREQVAAQILLQVYSRAERDEFTRARHHDLQRFVKSHAEASADDERIESLQSTLDVLNEHSGELSPLLRNRAMTVSLVLLAWHERMYEDPDVMPEFVGFARQFMGRLQWQVDNMKQFTVDDRYPYLVEFQRHLTQASVEKPAVQRRHELLLQEWHRWRESGSLTGDHEYLRDTGDKPPAVLPDS